MKGIILAAGPGIRMRPLTHTGPKHMIFIGGKPVMQYGLEQIRDAGINEIGIVIGYMGEAIRNYFGDGSKFGVKITYIVQEKPRGIAHAVDISKKFIGNETFVLYLGDNIMRSGIKELVERFRNSDYDALVVLSEVSDPSRFGVAVMAGGKLVKLLEKPVEHVSNMALTGVYLFRPAIFDMIKKLKPSFRNELEITDAIQELVDNKYNVHAQVVGDWWKDTGMPDDLLEANKLVLSELQPEKVPDGITARGAVKIGKNVKFGEEVILRGPLVIGDECSIENSVIGPHVSLGDNSKVFSSIISNSIILDNCDIQQVFLSDSIIGRCCKICPKVGRPKLIIGDHSTVEI